MAAPQTTLSGSINAAVTSLAVNDALGFAASTDTDDVILIDSEFIRVTAGMGGTTWTVSRGYAGSTAASHTSGATVTRIARGYTDLARIKQLYGFQDTDDDARLLDLIDAVNAELDFRLGVPLYPATDTVRLYDGVNATFGYRKLWIPGGIRTLTGIRIADESNGTLAAATLADFLLRPQAFTMRPGEPYKYLLVVDNPAGDHPWFPPYLANVELTGTFGPAAALPNASRLADMLVMRCWEARGAGTLTTPTPSKFIFGDDAAMLDAIRAEHVSVAG